jgi:hypothetical protein
MNRRNPHPGETRYTNYGSIGGNGKYLDPHNKGTDSPVSLLISTESTMITDNGTNTGTEASGQVYAPDQVDPIRHGDTLTLIYPSGTEQTWTARFTNNGHGEGHPAF